MKANNSFEQLQIEVIQLKRQLLLQHKTTFTLDEACEYAGIAKSYMYKMTDQLPFSKPNGKKLYISKHDLDNWLLSNRSKSGEQRSREAATYVATH